MPDRPLTFRAFVLPGIEAVRRMWKPIVLLQLLGAAVVTGYFTLDFVRRPLDAMGQLKASIGWLYPAIASSIAGGVLPEVAKFVTKIDRRLDRPRLKHTLFNMGLFAVSGVTGDALYRLFEIWPGTIASVRVVLLKMALDMLIYTPLVGLMVIAVPYTWREERYSVRRLARRIGRDWYVKRVATMLIPNWAYWFPMCALMYSLPTGITFVFSNFASAASATLLTTIAASTGKKDDPLLQGPRGMPIPEVEAELATDEHG